MMKKIGLGAALLALCLALTGCITINTPGAAPAATVQPEIEPLDEAVLDFGDAEEDLGDEYVIERTLVPATEADQVGGVKVDYVVQGAQFGMQIDEIAEYANEYIGKNFSLVGSVLLYDEANPDTNFAIVRQYEEDETDEDSHVIDPDTGEVLEHNHDPVLTGFDCKYGGAIPAEDAWVRAVGTLVEYEYKDDETGETFPALKLDLLYVAPVPDTEDGPKEIAW